MEPCTFKVYEQEYQNLIAVAAVLQATSKHKARYTVEDVYFDFGQNLFWTTVVREGWVGCQVFSPKLWEEVCKAKTVNDLFNCVNEIKGGKYFDD